MLKRQAKLIYGDRRSRMVTTLGKECILTRRKHSYPSTGVSSLSFLQQIFLTQELNQGLLHCRCILYQLSYQGSPYPSKILVMLFILSQWCFYKVLCFAILINLMFVYFWPCCTARGILVSQSQVELMSPA